MGKRKGYKAVYGGNTDQSTKKCKYSANSIDANENTKGYLLSYRRNCLKQAFRESFSIIKYFTHSLYPELVDENGDAPVAEEPEIDEGDIEAQLLAEAAKDNKKKEKRIFNIFETGVSQTLFMAANGDFNTQKVTDSMWKSILDQSVDNQILVPRFLERLLPICHVCEATKETITKTLVKMIETKFVELNEPAEYYVMPRVRFHPSIDRDDLLDMVKEQMIATRPDCKLNWKQTDLVIFVEILKRNCYLSIFTDWNVRQKYNWQEYHKRMIKKNVEENVEKNSKRMLKRIEKESCVESNVEKIESTEPEKVESTLPENVELPEPELLN